MEHVDDLTGTYAACRAWLRPGAVMSHQIDFKSHGTATAWNGHWAYSPAVWRLVRGGRSYLINRAPHSAHRTAIEAAGFDVLEDLLVTRRDGLKREHLPLPYSNLGEGDLTTAGAFIIAKARA